MSKGVVECGRSVWKLIRSIRSRLRDGLSWKGCIAVERQMPGATGYDNHFGC
jgi:hypothetical protein